MMTTMPARRRNRRAGERVLRTSSLPAARRRPRRVPPALGRRGAGAPTRISSGRREPYRDDRSILVAGCGTMQAAHYAVRWPRARVVGIDVSATSIAFTQELKRKHALDNLEVRQLAVERAAELGQTFDHVVCTGVLHHLARSRRRAARAARRARAGRRAQRDGLRAVRPRRASTCCRSTAGASASARRTPRSATSPQASRRCRPTIRSRRCLRNSPDFADTAGLADALLHPQDRAYSVPQLLDFLDRAGLAFGRWVRQAPYLPWCGALASTPHHARLARAAGRKSNTPPSNSSAGRWSATASSPTETSGPRRRSASISTAMRGSATSRFACPIRSPCASGCRRARRPC